MQNAVSTMLFHGSTPLDVAGPVHLASLADTLVVDRSAPTEPEYTVAQKRPFDPVPSKFARERLVSWKPLAPDVVAKAFLQGVHSTDITPAPSVPAQTRKRKISAVTFDSRATAKSRWDDPDAPEREKDEREFLPGIVEKRARQRRFRELTVCVGLVEANSTRASMSALCIDQESVRGQWRPIWRSSDADQEEVMKNTVARVVGDKMDLVRRLVQYVRELRARASWFALYALGFAQREGLSAADVRRRLDPFFLDSHATGNRGLRFWQSLASLVSHRLPLKQETGLLNPAMLSFHKEDDYLAIKEAYDSLEAQPELIPPAFSTDLGAVLGSGIPGTTRFELLARLREAAAAHTERDFSSHWNGRLYMMASSFSRQADRDRAAGIAADDSLSVPERFANIWAMQAGNPGRSRFAIVPFPSNAIPKSVLLSEEMLALALPAYPLLVDEAGVLVGALKGTAVWQERVAAESTRRFIAERTAKGVDGLELDLALVWRLVPGELLRHLLVDPRYLRGGSWHELKKLTGGFDSDGFVIHPHFTDARLPKLTKEGWEAELAIPEVGDVCLAAEIDIAKNRAQLGQDSVAYMTREVAYRKHGLDPPPKFASGAAAAHERAAGQRKSPPVDQKLVDALLKSGLHVLGLDVGTRFWLAGVFWHSLSGDIVQLLVKGSHMQEPARRFQRRMAVQRLDSDEFSSELLAAQEALAKREALLRGGLSEDVQLQDIATAISDFTEADRVAYESRYRDGKVALLEASREASKQSLADQVVEQITRQFGKNSSVKLTGEEVGRHIVAVGSEFDSFAAGTSGHRGLFLHVVKKARSVSILFMPPLMTSRSSYAPLDTSSSVWTSTSAANVARGVAALLTTPRSALHTAQTASCSSTVMSCRGKCTWT
ncbi:hypothetical protein DFJ74DRAFT_466722 [Hyaloraphidium curvatum]|nr:hypothetical protein DFJ74DRAFT_466722 [Hyaloraphidium curvatum]